MMGGGTTSSRYFTLGYALLCLAGCSIEPNPSPHSGPGQAAGDSFVNPTQDVGAVSDIQYGAEDTVPPPSDVATEDGFSAEDTSEDATGGTVEVDCVEYEPDEDEPLPMVTIELGGAHDELSCESLPTPLSHSFAFARVNLLINTPISQHAMCGWPIDEWCQEGKCHTDLVTEHVWLAETWYAGTGCPFVITPQTGAWKLPTDMGEISIVGVDLLDGVVGLGCAQVDTAEYIAHAYAACADNACVQAVDELADAAQSVMNTTIQFSFVGPGTDGPCGW